MSKLLYLRTFWRGESVWRSVSSADPIRSSPARNISVSPQNPMRRYCGCSKNSPGTTLVSYATDCEPDAMALIIGGATGSALGELKRQLEGAPDSARK